MRPAAACSRQAPISGSAPTRRPPRSRQRPPRSITCSSVAMQPMASTTCFHPAKATDMPTYDNFDAALPDLAAGTPHDTRLGAVNDTRVNLVALQDMMAAFAVMDNFDLAITASTADGPTQLTATNGTQVVKTDLTYG